MGRHGSYAAAIRSNRNLDGTARRALFGLAGICLLLGGCSHLGMAEKQSLIEANRLYSQDQISPAVQRLDRLIQDYGGAVEIAEAYYIRGLCKARVRQRDAARKDLEIALDKSKREDLTALTHASLATLAYERGDWSGAVKHYEKALPHLPDVPPKDQALYAAGLASQRIGEWKQARKYFAEILHKFKSQPSATGARQALLWRHSYYAIQLGAFRDSTNAGRAVQQWRAKGLDAGQESLSRGGQALWVVMAGRHPTYAEARDALVQVRKLSPQAYIIP